jgi:hypothetical protein
MNVKKRNVSFIERFMQVHLSVLSSFVVGKFYMNGNFTLKFLTKSYVDKIYSISHLLFR